MQLWSQSDDPESKDYQHVDENHFGIGAFV